MPVGYYAFKTNTGPFLVPFVSTDPSDPVPDQAWVLVTARVGQPIGLLMALTYATDLWQLSYVNTDSSITRVVVH